MNTRSLEESLKSIFPGFNCSLSSDYLNNTATLTLRTTIYNSTLHNNPREALSSLTASLLNLPFYTEQIEDLKRKIIELEYTVGELARYKTYFDLQYDLNHGRSDE